MSNHVFFAGVVFLGNIIMMVGTHGESKIIAWMVVLSLIAFTLSVFTGGVNDH